MLIPVAAETRFSGVAWTTYCLMLLSTLVWLCGAILQPDRIDMLLQYGYVPFLATPHTLLTSLFLHGSLLHLAGNMLFLWTFGPAVEHTVGHTRFALLYLAAGVTATLFHAWRIPEFMQDIPLIGASGAVAGIMGAFFIYHPRLHIRCILFYGLFQRVSVPAIVVLSIWLLMQLLLVQYLDDNTVAYEAHIGGFLLGFIAAMLHRHGWHFRRALTVVQTSQAVESIEQEWREASAKRRYQALDEALRDATDITPAIAYWRALSALRAGQVDTVRTLLAAAPLATLPAEHPLQLDLTLLRNALGHPPAGYTAMHALCTHLESTGATRQAVALLARLLAVQPQLPQRAQLLFRQARLCALHSDLQARARVLYAEVAAEFPDSPLGQEARFALQHQALPVA